MEIKAQASLRLRAIIFAFSFFALVSGASKSRASLDCEAQFRSFENGVLIHLPEQMRTKFSELAPKMRSRFSLRYLKRDRVRATAEAERLVAKTLLAKDTNLKLTPLVLGRETRVRSISQLLSNRLEHAVIREQLTERLLEIGYRNDSTRIQKWSAFQKRHFRGLESLKRFAINSASTTVFGLPLFLRPFQYQRFQLAHREGSPVATDWAQVEMAIRQKIESGDPALLREVKMEIAIEITRRIMAIGVLAILTDEFLEFAYPEWTPFKANAWNSVWPEMGLEKTFETKAELEKIAMTNWLEIAELLSGERPLPTSAEYKEIAARLRKMSQSELSAHVHNGAPLIDVPVDNLISFSQ
jgi:hypothetical protein